LNSYKHSDNHRFHKFIHSNHAQEPCSISNHHRIAKQEHKDSRRLAESPLPLGSSSQNPEMGVTLMHHASPGGPSKPPGGFWKISRNSKNATRTRYKHTIIINHYTVHAHI